MTGAGAAAASVASIPTASPSILVTRTPFPSSSNGPSITSLPTITGAPTMTSAPTTAVNITTTNIRASTTTAPSRLRPSTTAVQHPTMPTTPSSSPIQYTSPTLKPNNSHYHHVATPTISMIPTASSSPTTSRFPSIAPTSLVVPGVVSTPTSISSKTRSSSSSSSSPPTSSSSLGYSESCPGFTTADGGGSSTGLVKKDIIFTYMIQTTLTTPLNATTGFLTQLEMALLDQAANATLSCQDMSPFHIYQLSYPTITTTTKSSTVGVSNLASCQPTTTKTNAHAKSSCWLIQTHMMVTTDEDTTDWAKYTILAALQQELDSSSSSTMTTTNNNNNDSLLQLLPQLVSTHYIGPDLPSSLSTASPIDSLPPSSSSSSSSNGLLLPFSIVIIVLAVLSTTFTISLLVWIRHRRLKRLLEDTDDSSFLFSSQTTSRIIPKQPSPSNTTNTSLDADLEMAEISDLLKQSRRRLEQHPPPSFDSQEATNTSRRSSRRQATSTTDGTSHIHNNQVHRNASGSGNVRWKDAERYNVPSEEDGEEGHSPTNSSRESSQGHSSSRQRLGTAQVQDGSRRRAERILEASASFHSRLSWTSSLDNDSVMNLRTTTLPWEDDDNTSSSSMAETLDMTAHHTTSSDHDRRSVQETLDLARASIGLPTYRINSQHAPPPPSQALYHEHSAFSRPREDSVSAVYTTASATTNNTRDGLLRDSASRRHHQHVINSNVQLPDLGRPTRGTRDVYHRVQQHSLL